MKKVILILSIGIFVASCNQPKKETKPNDQMQLMASIDQIDDGYVLMKNNCYACHSPNTESHDSIVAPPFVAVKKHYLKHYDNQEDFVAAMVDWVQNPSEDKTKMPGAVKRFKVMAKMYVEKEDLEKIATYIYENDVEQPEWFDAHFKEMHEGGKMMKHNK